MLDKRNVLYIVILVVLIAIGGFFVWQIFQKEDYNKRELTQTFGVLEEKDTTLQNFDLKTVLKDDLNLLATQTDYKGSYDEYSFCSVNEASKLDCEPKFALTTSNQATPEALSFHNTVSVIWARNQYYLATDDNTEKTQMITDINNLYQWEQRADIQTVRYWFCYLLASPYQDQSLNADIKNQLADICYSSLPYSTTESFNYQSMSDPNIDLSTEIATQITQLDQQLTKKINSNHYDDTMDLIGNYRAAAYNFGNYYAQKYNFNLDSYLKSDVVYIPSWANQADINLSYEAMFLDHLFYLNQMIDTGNFSLADLCVAELNVNLYQRSSPNVALASIQDNLTEKIKQLKNNLEISPYDSAVCAKAMRDSNQTELTNYFTQLIVDELSRTNSEYTVGGFFFANPNENYLYLSTYLNSLTIGAASYEL